MAEKEVKLKINADASQGHKGIEDVSKALDGLGAKLGGEVGAQAQAAAAKLRELGQQEAAILNFQKLNTELDKAEKEFKDLEGEAKAFNQQIAASGPPTGAEAAALAKLRTNADAAATALGEQRTILGQATAELQRHGIAGAAASTALVRVKAEIKQTAQEAAQLEPKLTAVVQGFYGVAKASDATQGGIGKARQGLVSISKQLGEVREQAGRMGGVLASAFTFNQFVQAAAEMEKLQAGLQAVTGSATRAKEEMDFVRGVATRSGVEVTGAAQAYLGLMAATKGTAVEGKLTREVFEAVSTSMAKAGKSGAETQNALLALSQMAGKGTVQMEELRGQLGEALPGALQAAAKGMGITTADLIKLVESGQVAAEDLFPALTKGLNELYGSAPAAQTLSQEIANIKNAFIDMATHIGEAGGLDALKQGAELAQTAFVILDDTLVSTGKTIGVVLAALTSMDFSGVKQALADIESESRDKLLKAASHNQTLATYISAVGSESTKTALAQQQAAQATNAQAAAADKASTSYVKLGSDYAKVREELKGQIDLAEREVEAVKARGEANIAVAKLQSDEAVLRLNISKAAADEAKAMQDLAAKRQTEVNVLKAELDSKKVLLSASATVSDEKKKEIKTLEDLIAKKQIEADVTRAQAATSQALAKAKGPEIQALEQAAEAAKASHISKVSEAHATVAMLENQKNLASQSEQIAALMGNEVAVRRAKITQLEIDIKLTKAKAEVARAEAEGSIAVANATLAELKAKGPVPAVKEAEINASIRSAQAKLKEADAIRSSAEITDRELTNLRNGANDAGMGISHSMNAARDSVDGIGDAARGAAGAFGEMGDAAERAGKQVPKDNMGHESRMAGTSTGNRQGIIEWLKGAGLEEAVAEYISRDFVDANGKVAYMDNAGQKKWNGNTMSDALSNAVDYYKYGQGKEKAESINAEAQSDKNAKAKSSTSHASGQTSGSTYVSNINIGGVTKTVKFADSASQSATEQLLRELAGGKGVS